MPEDIDGHIGDLGWMRYLHQPERLHEPFSQALGDCCDEVRALEYVPHAHVVRNGEPDVSGDAASLQQLIDLPVSGAGRNHEQVLRR